jgi:hypothetical protein
VDPRRLGGLGSGVSGRNRCVLSASIPFAASAVSTVSYALASMGVSRSSSDDKNPHYVDNFIVVLGL